MKERIIRTIIMELNNRHRNNNVKRVAELNKFLRFVKSSDYFIGKKKKYYKIIINAKKN